MPGVSSRTRRKRRRAKGRFDFRSNFSRLVVLFVRDNGQFYFPIRNFRGRVSTVRLFGVTVSHARMFLLVDRILLQLQRSRRRRRRKRGRRTGSSGYRQPASHRRRSRGACRYYSQHSSLNRTLIRANVRHVRVVHSPKGRIPLTILIRVDRQRFISFLRSIFTRFVKGFYKSAQRRGPLRVERDNARRMRTRGPRRCNASMVRVSFTKSTDRFRRSTNSRFVSNRDRSF